MTARMSGSKSDKSLPASTHLLWMLYCEHKTGGGDAETVEIKAVSEAPRKPRAQGSQRRSAAHSCGHSELNLQRVWEGRATVMDMV